MLRRSRLIAVLLLAVLFVDWCPALPPIPGLLQAYRSEGELRLICVHYNGSSEQALRKLAPAELELATITLEDAFISYLSERGEKSFILSEML